MPLGPVNPEERMLWVFAQQQTQRSSPVTHPSFHRPALQAQAVSAENKDCRALLGGGYSGTQLPAGRPALTPSTGRLRTRVPWAEVRCLFGKQLLSLGRPPRTLSERRSPSGVPEEESLGHRLNKGIREPSPSSPGPPPTPSFEQETPGSPFWLQ